MCKLSEETFTRFPDVKSVCDWIVKTDKSNVAGYHMDYVPPAPAGNRPAYWRVKRCVVSSSDHQLNWVDV